MAKNKVNIKYIETVALAQINTAPPVELDPFPLTVISFI